MTEINQDPDIFLNMVNRHAEQEKNKRMTAEMLELVNSAKRKSVKSPSKSYSPTKYQTKQKKVSMNFKKKAILVFASVAVLAGALSLGVNSAKNTQARWNFTSEISEHVQDNIIYPKYQYDEYGNPAWYYDSVTDIARETLDENKEVDIDTRIYGTYNGLQTWQKDEYMDRVIREMRDIVNENPLNYTEEEITASNHSSFTDYLASLNMDKSTYLDYMREITTAYGRNDLNKVQELLQEFKGGSR